MSQTITHTVPLACWRGDRGTYHLLVIAGDAAEQIAMHERLRRLEFGARRGFSSVKVMARIGDSEWKSSVFPQKSPSSSRAVGRQERQWILLVSRKVMRAEDLAAGDEVSLALELL
ncbi:MAG: hypothetical protein A3J40_02185 [Erythrobacter sp. RIFCSPHIGHO2_12_FULL_63_10]|nr:MAG: hypothetical protein A3J40_02185 [Erythrobacter sp. RIFCSPHIGHO2_12_FULL_63_10]